MQWDSILCTGTVLRHWEDKEWQGKGEDYLSEIKSEHLSGSFPHLTAQRKIERERETSREADYPPPSSGEGGKSPLVVPGVQVVLGLWWALSSRAVLHTALMIALRKHSGGQLGVTVTWASTSQTGVVRRVCRISQLVDWALVILSASPFYSELCTSSLSSCSLWMPAWPSTWVSYLYLCLFCQHHRWFIEMKICVHIFLNNTKSFFLCDLHMQESIIINRISSSCADMGFIRKRC